MEDIIIIGGAFRNCTNIEKIEFEEGMEEVPYALFNEGGLKEGVKIIIPNTVTSIGSYAFKECTGIRDIAMPSHILKIGRNAFTKCVGLTEINIPSSVTTIGNESFYNCTNLTTVNFRGTEAQWNAISIGSSNDPLNSAAKNYNQ